MNLSIKVRKNEVTIIFARSYAPPPITDGTVTPQQEEIGNDIIPLIENELE